MAILSKGTTFADADQVTSTKLNNLVDNATFDANAVDGTTMQLVAGKLAVNVVETANINTSAVTATRLATDSVIEAKIQNSAVTANKIASDAVTTAKILDANVTASKLSGAQSGSAPIFGARAWANFNGTKDSGGNSSSSNTARLIRGSGNISSIVRDGVGAYIINFTTPMPDINYAIIAFSETNGVSGQSYQSIISTDPGTPQTTSSVRIISYGDSPNAGNRDKEVICIAVFR